MLQGPAVDCVCVLPKPQEPKPLEWGRVVPSALWMIEFVALMRHEIKRLQLVLRNRCLIVLLGGHVIGQEHGPGLSRIATEFQNALFMVATEEYMHVEYGSKHGMCILQQDCRHNWAYCRHMGHRSAYCTHSVVVGVGIAEILQTWWVCMLQRNCILEMGVHAADLLRTYVGVLQTYLSETLPIVPTR